MCYKHSDRLVGQYVHLWSPGNHHTLRSRPFQEPLGQVVVPTFPLQGPYEWHPTGFQGFCYRHELASRWDHDRPEADVGC